MEKEEVIEVDEDEDEEEARARAEAARRKKDDRIFGFNNFNDFRAKYFGGREVDPLEDFTRIQSIKQARQKYSKRGGGVNNQQVIMQA